MGKSAPTPPAPPDPKETIEAQAAANRLNVNTPTGSVRFGKPSDTVTITESDPQRQIREGQEGVALALGGRGADLTGALPTTPMTFDDAPALDFGGNREQFAQSIFERQKNLLQPEFDRESNRLTQSLANEGIPIDSELGQERLRQMQANQHTALQDASLGAVQAGAAEEDRQFLQALTRRQQATGETKALRDQALNELAQMLGLQQVGVGSLPQPTHQPVDAAGIIQNDFLARQAQHNAAMRNRQANMGALGSLGGTIFSAAAMSPHTGFLFGSDEATKDVYEEMSGEHILRGFKLMQPAYWSYKLDPAVHQGPMASEWQAVGASDGKTVDVIDAFGALAAAVGTLAKQVEALQESSCGGNCACQPHDK